MTWFGPRLESVMTQINLHEDGTTSCLFLSCWLSITPPKQFVSLPSERAVSKWQCPNAVLSTAVSRDGWQEISRLCRADSLRTLANFRG